MKLSGRGVVDNFWIHLLSAIQQYSRTESDVNEDDQTPLSKRSAFLSCVFGKGSPHRMKVGLASASL
jgi:hypothetical protein